MPPSLLLSTTPRSTFVWAADAQQAAAVRDALAADSHFTVPAADPHTVDVEIGAAAYEAVAALRDAGFTFQWHPTQRPKNRSGWPAEFVLSDEG